MATVPIHEKPIMTAPRPGRIHVHHALCVYAEPLVVDKRVLVVGDVSEGLGPLLLQLGARSVEFFDPDTQRARSARSSSTLAIHPLTHDTVTGRPATIDLALVPDLGLFTDAAKLIASLQEVVTMDGAVLVAARNPDAQTESAMEMQATLDYYELHELMADSFPHVRMIGELPFVGVVLAELGDAEGSPPITVDTQLAREPVPPEVFIVLASQSGIGLDPYALVQLPTIGESRSRHDRAADQKVAGLEVGLAAAVAHLREAEGRADDYLTRADQLTNEANLLQQELQDERGRNAKLVREFEHERSLRRKAEAELTIRRPDPELSEAKRRIAEYEELLLSAEQAHIAEIERFETSLRERAHVLKAFEEEVSRRERMVQELLGALEDSGASVATEPLREQLDRLALEVARREADVQTSAWTIAELEQRLVRAADAALPAPVRAPDPGDDVSRTNATSAAEEMQALRQALAQEHAQLSKLRSGEEWQKAEAELARQSVLVEQLSRALEECRQAQNESPRV